MAKNNSRLPDYDTLRKAGIDPVTRQPIKAVDKIYRKMKPEIKKVLRIKDEQEAINRYVWEGVPCNLTSQEIERLLYYHGQLVMFTTDDEHYYMMPYALNGSIDFYGRYNTVTPVPIASGTKEEYAKKRDLLAQYKLKVVYTLDETQKVDEEGNNTFDNKERGVIVWDYTRQLGETLIDRATLQDPVLDLMADCIPFMRTALLNSTGVEGVKVESADESSNVEAASRAIDTAALNGTKYIPIVGQSLQFQELTGGATAKAEEFMQAMQSLDNFRKSLYGIENGGLFEKKAHMLEDEQEMNGGGTNALLEDGLLIRQNFCDIANAVWGLQMTVSISDTALQPQVDDPMNDEDEPEKNGGNENE